jgi:hypothetical protein
LQAAELADADGRCSDGCEDEGVGSRKGLHHGPDYTRSGWRRTPCSHPHAMPVDFLNNGARYGIRPANEVIFRAQKLILTLVGTF